MNFPLRPLVTLLTVICCVSPASANEFFRIDTPSPFNLALAQDVAASGSLAVGQINSTSSPGLYWTPEDGRVVVPPLAPYDDLDFLDVSGNGEILVGRLIQKGAGNNETIAAFKYMVSTGEYELLPTRDDFEELTGAGAISRDGATIWGGARVGGELVSVVWREGQDVELFDFADFGLGEYIAASSDLSLWLFTDGVYYQAEDRSVMRPTQVPDGFSVSNISSTGDVAAGRVDGNAARWEIGGEVERLGTIPGFESSRVHGISLDGKVIFGDVLDPPAGPQEVRAMIWDAHNGMQQLEEVLLEEYGLETHPWGLQRTVAMSEDRMTITGFSRENRAASGSAGEMWVVQLDWPIGTRPGDLDFDDELEVTDVDVLQQLILEGTFDRQADFDRNGSVDSADLSYWIKELKQTFIGDANLDGQFNSSDLVAVFETGEYEDGVPANSTWSTGDWNADGEFNTTDMVVAFTDGGYEQGPRGAQAVPEPSSMLLILISFIGMLARRQALRRR